MRPGARCDGPETAVPRPRMAHPMGAAQPAYPTLRDLSSIYSDTVNDEDLFTFGALSVNPHAIYTVAVKGNIRREAGGTPTLDFRTKSGGTTSSGGTTGSARAPRMSGGAVSSRLTRTPAWPGRHRV